MRRLAPILFLALGLALSPATVAGDDPEPDVVRLLSVVRRDDDSGAWEDAVRDLRARGGDATARLDRTLAVLLEEKRRAFMIVARRIRALAARVGDGQESGRRLAAWDAAREKARAWIFSLESFPDIEGAIFGPQEGYEEAMARARAVVGRCRGLAGALNRAVAPLARLDPERARAMLVAHDDAKRALDRVAAHTVEGRSTAVPEAEVPDLARLLLDIRAGSFKAAARRFSTLPPGWIRLCVFEAYGRALVDRNSRDAAGMSKGAVMAIVSLNRYRMALGISPLSHNPRLSKMARDHSREMSKLGYLGHESPVPTNRTMRDRARNAGYRGWVEECVSGRFDPGKATETWKWDGGHHRILVRATHSEVGIGHIHKSPCTLNAGSGEPDSPPSIRY